MRLRWQDDAVTDLRQLRAYIAQDNPQAAARVARRIQQATSRLIDQPALGRPGRVPDTRELIISNTPYIVAYRITGTTVTILRVLHAARRWPERC
ncbi:MAG: type II toxin-antitoxin system RelE/ParE family toxin [Candidatus Competibacteraceae bacterium]